MSTIKALRVLHALAVLAAADDASIASMIGDAAAKLLRDAAAELRLQHLEPGQGYGYGCSVCDALSDAERLLAGF